MNLREGSSLLLLTFTLLHTSLYAETENIVTLEKKIQQKKKLIDKKIQAQSTVKQTIDKLAIKIRKEQVRLKALTRQQMQLESDIQRLSQHTTDAAGVRYPKAFPTYN